MSRLRQWFGPELTLIAIFVLISGALAYVGYRINQRVLVNGDVVQVTGRQRLEVQRLMRWLLETQLANGEARETARGELAKDYEAMTGMMDALRGGGPVQLGPTRIVLPPAALPPSATETFGQLDGLWQQFARQIAPIVDTTRPVDDDAITNALVAARQIEPGLSGLSSKFLGEVSVDSFRTAGLIRVVQLIGIVFGVAFISLLLFLYSRQLRKVRAAQKETDEILETVPTGLFLLDPNMRIGAQHSAALSSILQRENLSGTDFFQMLGSMVSGEVLMTARDYINLLFGDRVNEHLVASLNPLDQLEVKLPGESGRMETRWLGFAFRRVYEGEQLSHLLVSVSDVSDRVRLQRELEQAREQGDAQADKLLELFVSLTHVESGLLETRLERWERFLREANEVLKHQAHSQDEFHALINQVYRPIHALKGEASALGLSVIQQRATAVERELADLRTRQADLGGNDFLPVTVRLDELFSQFDAVRRVLARLGTLTPIAPPAAAAGKPSQAQAITKPGADTWALADEMARRAAETLGKRAQLTRQGLDHAQVPERYRQPLLDVLMQLVRNAVAHGIENPQQRRAAGKPEIGRLEAKLQREADGSYLFVFRDDGRGVDFEAVRQRAVEMGKARPESVDKLDARQLMGFLFEPGFSTAGARGDTAGDGVGLDLVRTRIREMGGQVGLSTAAGQGTQFKIKLPAA